MLQQGTELTLSVTECDNNNKRQILMNLNLNVAIPYRVNRFI